MQYIYPDKPTFDPLTQVCNPHYEMAGGAFVVGWKIEDRPVETDEMPHVEETPADPVAERIALLKRNLFATDYKALKYAEGVMTEEEYAPIRIQRQEWRKEINRLEVIANE